MKCDYILKLACLLCATMMPITTRSQLTYAVNGGAITITGYTGSDSDVTIPAMIDGLPVTTIGAKAFYECSSVVNVTIPNSVNNIETWAFEWCPNLASVIMPYSVTNFGSYMFYECTSLTNVTIPNGVTVVGEGEFCNCPLPSITIPDSVTNISDDAFYACNLTNVILPDSVQSIGEASFAFCGALNSVTFGSDLNSIGIEAFWGCYNLNTIYSRGNAPDSGVIAFSPNNSSIVYRLPNATNWSTTYDGIPTALWLPEIKNSSMNYNVLTNQFGFNIAWTSGQTIIVEVCTNLANPSWSPVMTNILTSTSDYINDPLWTNSTSRFYRLRSP